MAYEEKKAKIELVKKKMQMKKSGFVKTGALGFTFPGVDPNAIVA